MAPWLRVMCQLIMVSCSPHHCTLCVRWMGSSLDVSNNALGGGLDALSGLTRLRCVAPSVWDLVLELHGGPGCVLVPWAAVQAVWTATVQCSNRCLIASECGGTRTVRPAADVATDSGPMLLVLLLTLVHRLLSVQGNAMTGVPSVLSGLTGLA